MPRFPSPLALSFVVVASILPAVSQPAFARGGATGLGTAGYGAPTVGGAGFAGRFGATGSNQRAFGSGRYARGRFDARRSYYPSAPFGPFGGYSSSYPATGYAAGAPYVEGAPRTVTIIRRSPAFGEPGYVSRPVIYRLTPAASRTPGTRRFKVDRLEF